MNNNLCNSLNYNSLQNLHISNNLWWQILNYLLGYMLLQVTDHRVCSKPVIITLKCVIILMNVKQVEKELMN